jgi:macrolide-specific efflux system membrane fusion protein
MNRRGLTSLVLISALAVTAACSRGAGSGSSRYLTEPVSVGDVEKTVLSTGTLQPLEVVNVGAQATGQIQSLKVQLGDTVKKGQLLGVIDPAIQQNTLENAQAALASQQGLKAVQEATAAKADLDLKRQDALLKQGFSSKSAYDDAAAQANIAHANVASITAQVNQAKLAVDKAKVDLDRTNVFAPIDGVVASILVREGQTVNAVQVSPTLLRLAKMDIMTVKAQISEADVINVHPGQPVFFTILGDASRRYYSTIRSVEPAPDTAGDTLTAPANTAIYYNAVFDVPNTDGRLRSSMTAQVNVVLGQAKGVLMAPTGALGKQGADGRYTVKVLDANGLAHDRQVKVGVIDNAHFQILDGLKKGEKVVVSDAWNASVSGVPQPKAK